MTNYPLRCRIFGHDIRLIPTDRGIAGPMSCARPHCAWRDEGVKWPRPSRIAALTILIAILIAGSVLAQNHPLPAPETAPSICVNCPGANSAKEPNNGKKTFPFRAPILKHVGRLVDSSNTGNVQHLGIRTVRAEKILVANSQRGSAPPTVYVQLGEALGAYRLSTFEAKLRAGMQPVTRLPLNNPVKGRIPESVTVPDAFVYPEATGKSGWYVDLVDGQERLFDFDNDDRGNLYVAYDLFGWGIVADNGRTDGQHLTKIVQVFQGDKDGVSPDGTFGVRPESWVTPRIIISLKVGAKYYAVLSYPAGRRQQVWDVMNPSAPKTHGQRRNGPQWGIKAWSKHDASQRVALIGDDGILRIFAYDALISGMATLAAYTPDSGKKFWSLTFDEAGTLWVAQGSGGGQNQPSKNVLIRIKPSGATWAKDAYDVYGNAPYSPSEIHAAAGWIATAGPGSDGPGSALEVRLLKVTNGVPALVDANSFFRNFYHSAPSGFAQPPDNYMNEQKIALFTWAGKTSLIYNGFGIGDVFEIAVGGVTTPDPPNPPPPPPPNPPPPPSPAPCTCTCTCPAGCKCPGSL